MRFHAVGFGVVCLLGAASAFAAGPPHKQKVGSYVLPKGEVSGAVARTDVIHVAIGLPPRDAAGLSAFASEVSDPKSKSFHQFLTLAQVTEKYGPTAADYQKLKDWAKANHLAVDGEYPHRLLLGVSGPAPDVEKAFAVSLGNSKRPDGTKFYRPDRAPSLDLDVKVSHVAGIDNFFVPKQHGGTQLAGTAYATVDLRNAFAFNCLGLTGANESVGIMATSGYSHTDVASYETTVGLPSNNGAGCGLSTTTSAPCLTDVMINGFTGAINSYANEETAIIEVAIAMAPGLHQVKVFESDPSAGCAANDAAINAMVASTDVKQFSSSVTICLADNIPQFDTMTATGQSMFVASGDNGGGYTPTNQPVFNYWMQAKVTAVGGTVLSMNGAGVSYISEQAWKFSGGGIENLPTVTSTCTTGCTPGAVGCSGNCIPAYQSGVAGVNGASGTFRNEPDVAMPAMSLFSYFNGTAAAICGTSTAAPLWAAYTALMNQQKCINTPAACTAGQGFVAPLIYAIGGNSAIYASSFHDVSAMSADATCPFIGQSLTAGTGYDLATGWGTPQCGLIGQFTCTACAGAVASPGTPPSANCVNFETDPNNCGKCAFKCNVPGTCLNGTCTNGGSQGDTHITTIDGVYYDFQASGDFLLISTNSSFIVQARQASGAPNWPNAATNHAIAMRIGGHKIVFWLQPSRMIVDGQQSGLEDGKAVALPGVTIARTGGIYLLTSQVGEVVRVNLHDTWIDVNVGLGYAPNGKARGLLGDANGKAADDLVGPEGVVIAQPITFADLYHRYADTWRIDPKESLFGEGEAAAPGAPEKPFYANDLDPPQYDPARATCVAAGVKGEVLLDACTLDVAVIGNPGAATVFVGAPEPGTVSQPGNHPRNPGCGGCAAAPSPGSRTDGALLLALGLALFGIRRAARRRR